MLSSTNENVPETPSVTSHRPLWRNQDFLLLWSGQTISLIGTGVTQFAFPLLVLTLTQSPALTGLIAAVGALPYLFLSLPAGALIDRWDRKKVMIICDACRALNIASIPFALILNHLTVVQLFIVSLVEGTFFVFFNIAEAASLPNVVPVEQLPQGVSLNEATISAASLISPSLGGLLFSLGKMFPFLGDAISYAASVVSLSFIKANFQEERQNVQSSLFTQIVEGLSWLWHQPLVRSLALLTGGINVLFAGETLVVIVLAQHLGASPFFIGLIFAIGGIGSIIGAMLGALVQKRFRFGTVILGTCWVVALLYPLYIIVPNPFLLGLITLGIFFVFPLYNIVQFSYRLALIPDELQGRVNSVFRLVAFGFNPLGLALTGILLQAVGNSLTVLITTLGLLILAVLATLNTHIRNARDYSEISAR